MKLYIDVCGISVQEECTVLDRLLVIRAMIRPLTRPLSKHPWHMHQ